MLTRRISMRVLLSLLGIGLLTSEALAATATPLPFSFQAVMTQGSPSPVGGTFSAATFGAPALNNAGAVAFRAGIEGADATMGVFLSQEGTTQVLALDTHSAPGGGTFSDFHGVRIDDLGRVTFRAQVRDGEAEEGIFQFQSGAMSRLLATGDLGPDGVGVLAGIFDLHVTPGGAIFVHALQSGGSTQGGILALTPGGPAWVVYRGQPVAGLGVLTWIGAYWANGAGDVVFVAGTDDGLGTRSHGIFLASSGSITRLLAAGDPTPIGGSFVSFHGPTLNDLELVGFGASISGGSAPTALFVLEGSELKLVAGEGQGAPPPASGVFARFEWPRVDAAGNMLFEAHLSNGSAPGGIFRWSDGLLAAEILSLQPAPGGGRLFHPRLFQVNDQGALAFRADVLGPRAGGIFLKVPGLGIQAIARMGQATPAGGTYAEAILVPSLNNAGEVAFEASVLGGSAPEGIFVSRPSGIVPAALWGDPVPGEEGATLADVEAPSIGDSGAVAFLASLTNSACPRGLFLALRDDLGAYRIQAVALQGREAPGGTTYGMVGSPQLVGAGDVLFRALLLAPEGAKWAILRYSAGAVTPVVQQGEAAPPDVGGNFGRLGKPVGNPAGDLLFWSRIRDGASRAGLFLRTQKGTRTVVLDGTATPLGGTFTPIFRSYDLNGLREALFVAPIQGGVSDQAIFLWQDGSLRLVAAEGWVAPGGGRFLRIGHAELNDASQVAFQALVKPRKKGRLVGIFLADGGGIGPVVQTGTPSPVGGRFVNPSLPRLNDLTQIAFRAGVAARKKSTRGIFLASPMASAAP